MLIANKARFYYSSKPVLETAKFKWLVKKSTYLAGSLLIHAKFLTHVFDCSEVLWTR